MKIAELLGVIQNEFFARLDQKTGWGKEEVKKEYREAINATIMLMMDDLMEKKNK